MQENDIGAVIVRSAIVLHQELGPGLLESVYEVILSQELRKQGLFTRRQIPVAIQYQGMRFDEGFRADLLVEDKVLVELKSVENVHPFHKKQLLTYLKLSELRLGYLLNFGQGLMRDGITRIINGCLGSH